MATRRPTEEELHTFVTLLRGGADVDAVLAYLDIPKKMFRTWMGMKHTEFYKAVNNAMAEANLRDFRVITEAAQSSWQAAHGARLSSATTSTGLGS
jgi:hypothetical protein